MIDSAQNRGHSRGAAREQDGNCIWQAERSASPILQSQVARHYCTEEREAGKERGSVIGKGERGRERDRCIDRYIDRYSMCVCVCTSIISLK